MLTDKQKLFTDEYLIVLNATRAYKAVRVSQLNNESSYNLTYWLVNKIINYLNQ